MNLTQSGLFLRCICYLPIVITCCSKMKTVISDTKYLQQKQCRLGLQSKSLSMNLINNWQISALLASNITRFLRSHIYLFVYKSVRIMDKEIGTDWMEYKGKIYMFNKKSWNWVTITKTAIKVLTVTGYTLPRNKSKLVFKVDVTK